MWLEFADRSLLFSANQHPKSTIEKKAQIPLWHTWNFSSMCLPCLIIKNSCYFDSRINKHFTCSRCMIRISCSVHVISMYYMSKGFLFHCNCPHISKGQKKTIVWLLGAKIITYPLVLQNERLFPLGLSLLKINSTWFYSNNQITQLWFLQFNYQFLIIWLNEASLQLSVSSQKLHACSLVCYLTFWVMNTENKTYNPYQISLAVSQHFNFHISHKN